MSKSESSESKMAGARVQADLHRKLRLRAAREDKSQADVVRDALRKYLD